MPIVNQVAAVVAQLNSAPVFAYGTKKELNLATDKMNFGNGVVFLLTLKPILKNNTISNAINSRFQILMQFLYKTEFDQYTSQNETYIERADDLQNEFLVKLQHYRQTPLESRFFKITVPEKENSIPVYNIYDANTTGMSLTLTLETMNNDNIDPNSRPPGWVAGPYG